MPQGLALHIGLNAVDPGQYNGWVGELVACEADAKDMRLISESKGFTAITLLTRDATRENVIKAIGSAADKLRPGDIFFLSYSGHGGQLPDLNSDEDDDLDETWCLFDGEYVDDEQYYALSRFTSGVRVIVLSDSCHSGTVVKQASVAAFYRHLGSAERFRAMPGPVANSVYYARKQYYDQILLDPKFEHVRDSVRATVILISACQDSQLAADGPFNGRFTAALKSVWNGGKFSRDYLALRKEISEKMQAPDQTPNYLRIGSPNPAFEAQTPFTI